MTTRNSRANFMAGSLTALQLAAGKPHILESPRVRKYFLMMDPLERERFLDMLSPSERETFVRTLRNMRA